MSHHEEKNQADRAKNKAGEFAGKTQEQLKNRSQDPRNKGREATETAGQARTNEAQQRNERPFDR